ncbi:SLIT and NTRK-like protein 5 [Ictalurus furcatus]|uniref:SLIT and NTRK-like protein 5 n=1 Tax=Ictalurus furcatus TaxID=66913 RepID=UPI002350EB45|nr:SLIT and NTRK-like protein 5 [Ictalurus furcatus]
MLINMKVCVTAISFITISICFTETFDIYEEVCERLCVCEEKDGVSTTSCERRGIVSLSEVGFLRFNTHHLFLSGNLLKKLSFDDFSRYEGLRILHLGSNDIAEIEAGAFNGLNGLKRLHLNNNKIEVLRDDTFIGLERLEYLQVDYNYISRIEPNTLGGLHCLDVLILNDNLLYSLPKNVFQSVSLTHLDLRGNQLKVLPYNGLLEHLSKIVEIQLEENPWNCTCELIGLKDWLESISYKALAGDIVCETPFRLHGRDLDVISKQELCPRRAVAEYEMGAEAFHKPEAIASSNIVRSTQPTKSSRQSGKLRTKPTARASSSKPQNYGPVVAYQTKSPVSLECPTACTCNLQISDLGLNVNCQERKIERISDLNPKPYNPKKMYLTGNYITSLQSSDFLDTTGLDLIHLGNNRISIIHSKAFVELQNLRRLYLNGNLIERLTNYMFSGLENLQFLYLEYNVIREIETGTFENVPNLQLLFLNNNLLKTLPTGVFRGSNLARLNLRNNHLRNMPVDGVLEDLTSLVQIDLFENPWDCSCSIVEMKKWLEELSSGTVVNDVICESPPKFSGEDLHRVHSSDLCPVDLNVQTSLLPPSEESFPGSTVTLETTLDYNSLDPMMPLSVLILTVLLIFIVTVFITAGLCTMFKIKRQKKHKSRNTDTRSFDIIYVDRPGAKVRTSAGHVYEYVPPLPASKCTMDGVLEERYTDFDEQNALSYTSDEELRSIVNGSEFSASNRPSPLQEDNLFYREILARSHQGSCRSSLLCKHSTAQFSPDYNVPQQYLHPDRIQQTMMYVKPNRGEYWELNAQLNFEPDYLEVHEKRTTFTQF